VCPRKPEERDHTSALVLERPGCNFYRFNENVCRQIGLNSGRDADAGTQMRNLATFLRQ